jgi:Zn-finger nucleic acid-binding protein
MKCLSCRGEMLEKLAQSPRGPVYYDVCEACGGIWFDPGEMDAMVLQRVYQSVELESRDMAKGVSESLRRCPRCADQWLDKVFFLTYSEILLDHCDNCHGFWLDGGEYERINLELAEIRSKRGHSEHWERLFTLLGPFLSPDSLILCLLSR